MTMKLPTLLLSAVLLAATLPAAAEVGRDAAAAAAQRETGGRVLSVDRTQAGGRAAWRVKVVTRGGEVRVVLIDAASGRPM
ncbi:MAG: PepSY domain-containing protein [Ramlibacter sp.]